MGQKVNVKFVFIFFAFLALSLIFYYPLIFGKIPFNGNLLVAFWSPWRNVSWEGFPTGVPFKFMGVDEVREFYPLLDFTYDSFKSAQIPLWNPYNFSGYPHLANWASAVFYPLHVLIFIFSKTWVFISLKLSAIILAGVFTYIYLRTIKLGETASYFGALAFALSATLQIWNAEIWQSTHAFMWLPLVLFSIEKLIREHKIHFALLLSLAVAMSVMAGYIQPTIYLILFALLYSIFRIIQEKKKQLECFLKIIVGFVLGFIISSIQLIPAIEAYLLSPRSQVSLHDLNISFLIPLSQVVTLFVPDFFGNIVTQNWFIARPGQYYENMIYIGVVPLILASLAIYLRKYRSYVLFFCASAIVSLSLTLDLPTSRLIYDLSIPFLSGAIPIRIIFVFAFSTAILSAFGIEWWVKEQSKLKTLYGILPLLLIFGIIGFFVASSISRDLQFPNFPPDWYFTSVRNLVLPIAFFALTLFMLFLGQYLTVYKKYLGAILSGILLAHAFLFFQKYASFSDKEFLYPTHPLIKYLKDNQGFFRYWGYGSAAIANNFATVYKIYSPEGYDPVNISFYNELLSSSRNAKFEGSFSRSDALLYPVTEFPFKDINDVRYRIMDILGIKHIGFEKSELEKIDKNRLGPERYKKVWEKDNFIVFENKKVFPRAFLADQFVYKTKKQDILKTIYDRDTDLATTVVVSEKFLANTQEGRGRAEIVSYSPNRVDIEVDSPSPKILVLSDAFYPGWKAWINQQETKIYRADYALRAIIVPKGKSRVVFSYQPFSFFAGILITLLSLLIAGYIFVRNKSNVN